MINIWQGGAAAVKQQVRLTPGGTIEADDLFRVQIGQRILEVAAGGTAAADVVDALVAAWATAGPEFDELAITDEGDTALVEAKEAGVPFTLAVSTVEAGGGAADDQTFGQSTVTANSGPYCWDVPSNWSEGAVPVNGDDVVLENSDVDILYGLDQSAVTLASLTRRQSFTGRVGLPQWNSGGYAEYRGCYLQVGATEVFLGDGDGAGPVYERYDFGSGQTAVTVNGTATVRDERGVPSCLVLGTHASNVLVVNRGDVGSAQFAGEASTWDEIRIGYRTQPEMDARVAVGEGATLGDVVKSGGVFSTRSDADAIHQLAGQTHLLGEAAVADLQLDGGACYPRSSGTIAAVKVGGGAVLDFRQDIRARTVSAAEVHRGASVHDPARTVTWTTGLDLVRCSPRDVVLDLGTHLTVSLADL